MLKLKKLSCVWFISLIALFVSFIFSIPRVMAAEWRIDPGISWRGTYDDNILFNNESDFVNLISPGMRLSGRTDRSNIDLSGLVNIFKYVENSEFDRVNQDYRLRAGHAVSPRLSVNLSSRLGIDYSFEEYFEEEGIVTDKIKRYLYNVSPGFRLALDDLSSLEFNVYYTVVDYSRDINPDYDVLGGGLTWSRTIMDGRTDIFVFTGFERAVYDLTAGETEQRVYRLMAGVRRRVTETLDFSFSAGPMWTESRNDAFNIKKDDLSYSLDGSLNWRLERTRLNLGVNRQESQSTYGENITRNQIRAGMTHDISSRWRTRVNGAFTRSQTDGFFRERKSESINFDTSLAYVIRPNMDLSLGYNFRRSEDKIASSIDRANRVYLMYSVSFPRVW
jgi:hypothetical protein